VQQRTRNNEFGELAWVLNVPNAYVISNLSDSIERIAILKTQPRRLGHEPTKALESTFDVFSP
jgi:hypothetical protein